MTNRPSKSADALLIQLTQCLNDAVILLAEDFSILALTPLAGNVFIPPLAIGSNLSSTVALDGMPVPACATTLQKQLNHYASQQSSTAASSVNNTLQWQVKKITGTQGEHYFLVSKKEISTPVFSHETINRYLESVIAHMPGHVFWKDCHSVYLGCNDKMAKICGLASHRDIVGKTDHDLIWGEELAAQFIQDDQEVISAGYAKSNIIEEHHYADQHDRVMLTNKVPLKDEEGKVFGLLGMAIDISEQKEIEAILTQEKLKSELASRAKSEFIANMSHDIRTPITGIIGMIQDLLYFSEDIESSVKEKTVMSPVPEHKCLQKLTARIKDNGSTVLQSIDELLRLCNEILEVVRLESGQMKVLPESFDIRELVKHNVNLLQVVAQHKHLTLSMAFDESVPRYLKGLSRYLNRCLLNLVSNSLKFTKQGTVAINVSIDGEKPSTPWSIGEEVTLKIVVEDTGIGIPSDKFDMIFDGFSRLTPSYDGIYKGSGLGLYMVKQYVDAMKGTVQVESEVNRYTRFTLTLPFIIDNSCVYEQEANTIAMQDMHLTDVKSVVNEHNEANDDNEEKTEKKPAAHILLVEDNTMAARAASVALNRLNCRIDIAENGQQALEKASYQHYDMIFMDIGLPDIDGIEVTKQIRQLTDQQKSTRPIVALTGHAAETQRAECLSAGMNDVLTKPAQLETLALMLQQYVFDDNALKSALATEATPIHPAHDVTVIDWKGCINAFEGNEETIDELLAMLAKDLKKTQQTVQSAYDANDVVAMREELHRCLGGIVYLRLPELEKTLKNYQAAIRNNQTDDLHRLNKAHSTFQQAIVNFWQALKVGR